MVMSGVTHRPFLLLALGFSAGIVLERCSALPVWSWSVALLLLLLIFLCPYWGRRPYALLIFSVCVCAGAMALRSYGTVPGTHISRFIQSGSAGSMQLKCRVVGAVAQQVFGRQKRVRFVAEAQEANIAGHLQKVSGRVMVTIFRAEEVELGDELLLSGSLRRPFTFSRQGRLSYADTLLSQKVIAAFNVKKKDPCQVLRKGAVYFWVQWSEACRLWINVVLVRYLSAGEAGLMEGLITGERGNIAWHVKEIFMRTGTTHLLAVSGLNVALVAFGIFFILSLLPVPRHVRMCCAILLTAWYAYVAGGSSPVVRSAVMSSVVILSFVLEREQDIINTLSVASMAILVVNPTQLFDVGFQLSFAGVLSLVLIGPVIAGIFPGGKSARLWNEYLGVSIAAFLGTTGVVAYYFGTITPVSLIANIPAVPLVAVITGLGAVLLIVSWIPILALVVAAVLKVAINLLVYILYSFAQIPQGFFYLPEVPALWLVLTYYFILLVLVLVASSRKKYILPGR